MKKQFVLLLIFSLVLTGCWDQRELNEISITMAIGIDESDDQYLVTAQVVVPTEVSMKASTGKAPVTLYQAEGETIFEAIRKLSEVAPREIYPGHLRLLVISESVAEKGIGKILDFFSRNWEMRSDFYIVVAKDMKAEEILNATTSIESIPANKMFNTIKSSNEVWSSTRGLTLDKLIREIASEGREPVITGIEVFGDLEIGASVQNVESITPLARIRLVDSAVFKKDKLVGWLTEKESRGYNAITNQVKSTLTILSCPEGGTVSIELIRDHADIKAKVINGKPEVEVTIHSEGNVGELNCKLDLTKAETISMLEKIYSEKIKEIIHASITTLQKDYKADIFGFGDAVHRADPKAWKKLKTDWDQEFSDLKVNVKVDAKIRLIGTVNNSFQIK